MTKIYYTILGDDSRIVADIERTYFSSAASGKQNKLFIPILVDLNEKDSVSFGKQDEQVSDYVGLNHQSYFPIHFIGLNPKDSTNYGLSMNILSDIEVLVEFRLNFIEQVSLDIDEAIENILIDVDRYRVSDILEVDNRKFQSNLLRLTTFGHTGLRTTFRVTPPMTTIHLSTTNTGGPIPIDNIQLGIPAIGIFTRSNCCASGFLLSAG